MKTPTKFFKISTLFAFLIFLTAFTSKAQITITESDMPQAGQVYIEPWDTLPTVNPGSAGANQVWNLSAINNDFNDTLFYLTPASTPYSSYFSSSNLAEKTVLGGPHAVKGSYGYDYFNLSSGSNIMLGEYEVKPSTLIDSMNSEGMVLPMTYHTNWNQQNFRSIMILPGISKQISLTHQWDTVDGWGTVTTPVGSFNSLRLKQISITIYDSIFIWSGSNWSFFMVNNTGFTRGETFTWFANGKGTAVAEITMDSAGGSKPTLAFYLNHSFAGINEISDNASTDLVYPNPFSRNINVIINQPGNVTLTLYNMVGQAVGSWQMEQGQHFIDVQNMPAGVYMMQFKAENGSLYTRKLVKIN